MMSVEVSAEVRALRAAAVDLQEIRELQELRVGNEKEVKGQHRATSVCVCACVNRAAAGERF